MHAQTKFSIDTHAQADNYAHMHAQTDRTRVTGLSVNLWGTGACFGLHAAAHHWQNVSLKGHA